MFFGWFRRRKPKRALPEEVPADWRPHLEAQPFVSLLSTEETCRLVDLARSFEERVHFEGCAGMQVDDEVRRSIALQACRLILYLGSEAYRRVKTVLVYPSSFQAEIEGKRQDVSGLAVPDGPVLLAWDQVRLGARDARDGKNLVYHEFAHKLDMLDGQTDGTPPLPSREQADAWREIMGRQHRRLRWAARRRRRTLIDPYGATSPAEFFAEATEVFFERPRKLKKAHRRLYRTLARFYRQDPARRVRP